MNKEKNRNSSSSKKEAGKDQAELMTVTSIKLSEKQRKKLKILAFATNESLNKHLINAVNLYLATESVKKILKDFSVT
jgi:hypothetical protein